MHASQLSLAIFFISIYNIDEKKFSPIEQLLMDAQPLSTASKFSETWELFWINKKKFKMVWFGLQNDESYL